MNAVFIRSHIDASPAEALKVRKAFEFQHRPPKICGQFKDWNLAPEKRLRIGYVSSDFRLHSAASTFLQLIEGYDKEKFQVFAYADLLRYKEDDVTERVKKAVDVYRDARKLHVEQLCALVRADKIDILVDLVGYTES